MIPHKIISTKPEPEQLKPLPKMLDAKSEVVSSKNPLINEISGSSCSDEILKIPTVSIQPLILERFPQDNQKNKKKEPSTKSQLIISKAVLMQDRLPNSDFHVIEIPDATYLSPPFSPKVSCLNVISDLPPLFGSNFQNQFTFDREVFSQPADES